MPINWLFSDPAMFFIWIGAILVAITIHEFSHAVGAKYFGDNTAESMGRISLNPLAHLDLLGFLMLVFIGFGWAKPVEVNPNNFRNARRANAWVSLAGPIANLLAIVLFGIALKIIGPALGPANLLVNFLFLSVLINTVLMLFNLIPIPPLDGSKVLFSILPDRYNGFKEKLSLNGPFILLGLILADSLFNLGIFANLFGWAIDLISVIFG